MHGPVENIYVCVLYKKCMGRGHEDCLPCIWAWALRTNVGEAHDSEN
jgi:hypothetical protein